MSALLKCHINYLLNKKTIIILIISLLIISGLFISNAFTYQHYPYKTAKSLYLSESIMIINLLISFIFIFIYGNAFIFKNDNYGYLIISYGIGRFKYFFSKILSLTIIYITYFTILYLLFITMGMLIIPNYVIALEEFKVWINILIVNYYYNLISVTLILVLKNIYSIILPLIIRILSLTNEMDAFKYFFISEKNLITIVNYLYQIFLILLILIINNMVFYYRDYVE